MYYKIYNYMFVYYRKSGEDVNYSMLSTDQAVFGILFSKQVVSILRVIHFKILYLEVIEYVIFYPKNTNGYESFR